MIDFHTHILPGIDDGSQSVEESLQMLSELKRQNVVTVAATPHYYAFRRTPAEFFERRQKAYDKLCIRRQEETPEILLGAEVLYFPGISRMEELNDFCIGNTDLLLLEMPFETWNRSVIREVKGLALSGKVRILIAHLERYYSDQPEKVWDDFLEQGIMMQANAEFFLSLMTRRKAIRLLKEGRIHVLGTDCHNMKNRRPRMDDAVKRIEKHLGTEAMDDMENFGRMILGR